MRLTLITTELAQVVNLALLEGDAGPRLFFLELTPNICANLEVRIRARGNGEIAIIIIKIDPMTITCIHSSAALRCGESSR